ncbi:DNA methyltransferase [Shinella granuli]|uniref:site-specific DNA-methyltransferase (adenine-specific) n=1 Tax=Shinella granuli TaxID=323621 RepID=A0A4R2C541_SHIGR|nr:DNA methyltransferase [Shinella granuli]TCN34973.1 adenine specific DNA methylase Mod [Shinella granuli]
MNKLWYGDNLTIMQSMKKHSVDLIYLDPPFKSDANYNLLYKNLTGKPVPEQAEAFFDTWELDAAKLEAARTMPVLMREHGVDDNYVAFWNIWISALRNSQPQLLAYLIYMVQRLLHMKSILRPTGSIYLHCDPAASHYIKVMMDGIFGHENFRNEIIWKRTGAHGGATRWGDIHDVILFYTASSKYKWNRVLQAHDPDYIDTKYRFVDKRGQYRLVVLTGPGITRGASGQPWRGYNPTDANRHWAVPKRAIQALRDEGVEIPEDLHEQLELLYQHDLIRFPERGRGGGPGVPEFKLHLEKGQPIQDMILDIPPINSQAKERLGYPTQKPIALLDRIIQASSDKGDVVFDPFCGCGTTVYSAVKNERQWIGCDIAILSIKLVREVLTERHRLVEGHHFEVDGIPVSVEQAQELFSRDAFQFQHWVVEKVGGFPMQKKVADRGIDGRMYFETKDALGEMIISVKGGKLKPSDVRDLRGVIERERSSLGGFLSLQEPSKAMRTEAAEAGFFEYNGNRYPRIQLLTVREILEEKREFHMPTRVNTKITTGQQSLPL